MTNCSRCGDEIPNGEKIVCITASKGKLFLCEEHAEEVFYLVNAAKEATWDKYFDLCKEYKT